MKYMKLTDEQKERHPSIHYTGSVRGMKKLGYWGKHDVCVRCGQYIYTNLGNGINHELCMKFVKSGYDLKVIEESV